LFIYCYVLHKGQKKKKIVSHTFSLVNLDHRHDIAKQLVIV